MRDHVKKWPRTCRIRVKHSVSGLGSCPVMGSFLDVMGLKLGYPSRARLCGPHRRARAGMI